MNSDVPSSERELSQDGSSQNDSNQDSVSSNTGAESSYPVEICDKSKVDSDSDDDSIDKASDQSETISDQNIKAPDTEARFYESTR